MNKPSMMTAAKRFMQGTRCREVLQGDLLTIIAKKTGCSRESVRGSIIGGANGRKLFGQPEFKKHWVVCIADKSRGKRKRFVRRPYITPEDIEATIDYNTSNKQKARERGLKHLKSGPQKVKVITLAAAEGYCVKLILKRCPKAEIINVECCPTTLAEWQKKGIPTQDRLCYVADFIRSEEFQQNQYKLFNLDLMGYACPSLGEDLTHLNTLANVEIIVLNIAGRRRFRNTGARFNRMRTRYYSDDPIREWVLDMVPNYRVLDEWFYKRESVRPCPPMRMFVLKRKHRVAA